MIRLREKIVLSEYTLIIPSVSVGNVGQLTNDLLICAFNLKLVGTIYHKALIPAVGPNPYDPKAEICSACEIYACQKDKIAILQLRTSIEQKHAEEFFDDLKTFIGEQKFKEVLILTSSYAHEKHNIRSSPYRYITNKQVNDFDKFNVLPMEQTENNGYVIYGSGYAYKLYNKLKDIVQLSVIIKYTSEGDNRPDAFSMFYMVIDLIGLKYDSSDIKQPYSWSLVYGSPPPLGIY